MPETEQQLDSPQCSPPRKPLSPARTRFAPTTPQSETIKAARSFASLPKPQLKASTSCWDLIKADNSSVRTLAQGRVHAKENIQELDAWRARITHEFLEATTSSPPLKLARRKVDVHTPDEPHPRSPGHYEREYGMRRSAWNATFASPRTATRSTLRPLKRLNGQTRADVLRLEAGHDPTTPNPRAAQCLQTRTVCWKRSGSLASLLDATRRSVDPAAKLDRHRGLDPAMYPGERNFWS